MPKWKIQGLSVACRSYKNHFFCLIYLCFLKYTAYQTKGRKICSKFFDQFCCFASVPWLNGSDIHSMYCGTLCARRDANSSISLFPNIWQILRTSFIFQFNFRYEGSFSCPDWKSAWVFITLGRYSAVVVIPRKK